MKIAYELPERVLNNEELSALYPGWTEEKILAKTGIASRRISGDDETAVDLAERAARKLFAEYEYDIAKEIDFVLLCTQSPDYKLPSSACLLQNRLGISTNSGALDYDLGCSGFVYGLSLAKGLVLGGMARKVLLLTAETYSKYIHPMDKSARTIFGDGAAATIIDADSVRQIGEFVFGTDGAQADRLIVKNGGARHPFAGRDGQLLPEVCQPASETDASGNVRTCNNIYMSGPDIFNFTLDVVPPAIEDVCHKNGITRDDVDLFVFHQANKFMLDTLRKVNMISREKFYVDLVDVGNTVSSTIPIALARAVSNGTLRPGMKVMLVGFGVGLSWGATIIDWQ